MNNIYIAILICITYVALDYIKYNVISKNKNTYNFSELIPIVVVVFIMSLGMLHCLIENTETGEKRLMTGFDD